MKRITLMAVLTALVSTLAAQSVVLAEPHNNLWPYRSTLYTTPVGQDDENAYFFLHDRSVPGFKPKTFTDHLYVIDNGTLKKKADVALTVSNRHTFLGGVNGENGVYVLYASLPGKGDKMVFTLADLGKKTRTMTLSDNNTVTAAANPKFWPEFKTAKSPDGKLFATLAVVTGKDSRLEGLFAVVINNEGEFLWSGPVTPQFDGTSYSLGDPAVDDGGNLYVPAYTCQVSGKTVSNVRLMMVRANGDGTDSFTEGTDFGTPQDFTAKATASGDVVVAGFYTDARTNTSTKSVGYYFYRFNPKSETITDIQNFTFSDGYVQREAWARFASVLGNQQYSISADDIFELQDGSLVLCGEHRFVKVVRDLQTNSTSYQTLTKNILVATLLPDGGTRFSMVEKQQSSGQGLYPSDSWWPSCISYTAFAHGNDMYFLFTEDNKNIPYPGGGKLCSLDGITFKNAWTNVLMRLTPDQELTQRELKDAKQLLRHVDFTDGEYFYASGIGKSNLFFNKFKIEE